jgi:hypothetical protein
MSRSFSTCLDHSQSRLAVSCASLRITYQATLSKEISHHGGVQQKLNKLAKRPDFKNLLQIQVTQCKLVLKDVEACVPNIYHEVSKHAHGNTGVVELRGNDYTVNDLAVLAAFFELQKQWTNPLVWKEV